MTVKLSKEKTAFIKKLREQGLTGYEIAEKIGVGKTSAYKYIKEKSCPRWTEKEKQVVVNGYAKGYTAEKIAKKLKRRSAAGVKHIMHKHRKQIRNDPGAKIALCLLTRCLKAGLSPGEALQKIRRHDAFNRARKEIKSCDL